MKYSDVGHAFTEHMKINFIHLCKCSDDLVVTSITDLKLHRVRGSIAIHGYGDSW